MNDNVNTIVTVVLALIALAIVGSPIVLFFVYVGYQNWKRKNIRNRILSNGRSSTDQIQYYPARYAPEDRFKSWFKIFPWNSAGVIVSTPQGWKYIGEFNSGQQVTVSFQPQDVTWLGKQPFPNGALSWFLVGRPEGKHYFSSETGYFIIGSNRSTRELCDSVMHWQPPVQIPPTQRF